MQAPSRQVYQLAALGGPTVSEHWPEARLVSARASLGPTVSEHWPEARLVSASLGPTVSEHWSELAQRMTVAYGVKSGPRLRKEGRTMPVTWLRRGTISSRIARSLPTGRTRVGS